MSALILYAASGERRAGQLLLPDSHDAGSAALMASILAAPTSPARYKCRRPTLRNDEPGPLP